MVLLGFVISAIVSFIAVKWLLRYVQTHTFNAFGCIESRSPWESSSCCGRPRGNSIMASDAWTPGTFTAIRNGKTGGCATSRKH